MPVVVSSLTALLILAKSSRMKTFSSCKMHLKSGFAVLSGPRREPSLTNFCLNSLLLWIRREASSPSSPKCRARLARGQDDEVQDVQALL
eukprot:10903687-Heterocapsa_arctica.AAC.1